MSLVRLRHWMSRQRISLWRWLAWALPRPLVYWAAIRLMAFATVGQYGNTVVPELGAMEALRRWESAMRERDR